VPILLHVISPGVCSYLLLGSQGISRDLKPSYTHPIHILYRSYTKYFLWMKAFEYPRYACSEAQIEAALRSRLPPAVTRLVKVYLKLEGSDFTFTLEILVSSGDLNYPRKSAISPLQRISVGVMIL
jgi:hypothetical protein